MPPLAAGAHKIEQTIQQLSHVRGSRPSTGLGQRDKRLQQAELVVRQSWPEPKSPTSARSAGVHMAVSKQEPLATPPNRSGSTRQISPITPHHRSVFRNDRLAGRSWV